MNSIGMMRRLAQMGVGIAMLPEPIVQEDIQNGTLVRILSEFEAEPVTIFALTETRLIPAKTQVFIEFLQRKINL